MAKNAAAGAEAAAKDARDSVRREDRKAKLITKLTQLLSTTNEIRSHDESLFEAVCEPKLVDLRRELVACAHAASGNYPTINDQLKVAATLLDDIDQQRQGDAADVIAIRKRLLINVGNTISGLHSALELGTYDDG